MYRLDERKLRQLDYEKRIAFAVVHSSAIGLCAVLSQFKSEIDRVNFIKTYASPIRFYNDESGYFFVFTLDGLNIVHANPKELEGQNMFDVRDSKGDYFIRKMCAVAKRGGGFIEYFWAKPGSESGDPKRKLGYVEPIPGTNYFIGAGVYMED
jgi:signal transduction histidine kinase